MEVFNTPRVLLVGSWGSEGLVSALTDALYRGASWEEALGAQTQELVERRIAAFYRQGHWSVFEFMGAQFIVECSRACHTQFIRHRIASYWSESQRYVDYTKRKIRLTVKRICISANMSDVVTMPKAENLSEAVSQLIALRIIF